MILAMHLMLLLVIRLILIAELGIGVIVAILDVSGTLDIEAY